MHAVFLLSSVSTAQRAPLTVVDLPTLLRAGRLCRALFTLRGRAFPRRRLGQTFAGGGGGDRGALARLV
jgi:hypothetical protein